MIYEVRARLLFIKQDEATDFYHDCEVASAKAVSINADSINQETTHMELIANHHDESPHTPCELISSKEVI